MIAAPFTPYSTSVGSYLLLHSTTVPGIDTSSAAKCNSAFSVTETNTAEAPLHCLVVSDDSCELPEISIIASDNLLCDFIFVPAVLKNYAIFLLCLWRVLLALLSALLAAHWSTVVKQYSRSRQLRSFLGRQKRFSAARDLSFNVSHPLCLSMSTCALLSKEQLG